MPIAAVRIFGWTTGAPGPGCSVGFWRVQSIQNTKILASYNMHESRWRDRMVSPLPDEERSQMFTVFARGSRVRHLFFDLITAIETEGTLGAK